MLKLPLLLTLFATLLIAGCGGSGGGDDSSSPLDNALGYMPGNAPFVVAIDTDTDGDQYKAAGDLLERFPGSDGIADMAKSQLEDRAGRFEELQDALGNPFVVASTDARSFVDSGEGEDENFVGAIQAASEDSLDKLIEGDKATEDGEVEGAKLYKDDSGDSFAIDGDVLVVAGSKQQLEQALATRNGDDGMSEADFDAGTEGISQQALLRVYLNVAELLRSDSGSKDALKSKWVQAVRTAGIAVDVEGDQLAIDFNVATDAAGLTEDDLPIAAGAEAPQVLDREGELNLGLRDAAQLLEFVQATAKAVDPNGFSSFEAGKAQIERRLKIDLDDDLIAQLEGDLALSIDLGGKFGARSELADPAAFERTLAKLEPVLPNLAEGAAGGNVGFAKPKAGEDFYAVATSDGDQVVFGVVDDVFVIANDAAIAGRLAAEGTEAVPEAEGALVLKTDAERLAKLLLREAAGGQLGLGDQIAGAVGTRPLDDLLGSIEASTEGLSGNFTLTTDR